MTEIVPKIPENLRLEMEDTRSPYSAEDKMAVVMAYLITGGNSSKAAELSAVHEMKPATIRQWKSRAGWWDKAEQHAKALLQTDLDYAYTRMLHRTEKEIFDRVENGDTVLDKTGQPIRKPLGGKDLMYIHGIIHDKRAMLRGEPTSRTEKVNPMEVVQELANLLQKQGEKTKTPTAEEPWNDISETLTGDDSSTRTH